MNFIECFVATAIVVSFYGEERILFNEEIGNKLINNKIISKAKSIANRAGMSYEMTDDNGNATVIAFDNFGRLTD